MCCLQCTRELYFNFKKHLEQQEQLRQDRIQAAGKAVKDPADATKPATPAGEAGDGNGEAAAGDAGAALKKAKVSLPVVGKVLSAAAVQLWDHVKDDSTRLDALAADFRDFQAVCCRFYQCATRYGDRKDTVTFLSARSFATQTFFVSVPSVVCCSQSGVRVVMWRGVCSTARQSRQLRWKESAHGSLRRWCRCYRRHSGSANRWESPGA